MDKQVKIIVLLICFCCALKSLKLGAQIEEKAVQKTGFYYNNLKNQVSLNILAFGFQNLTLAYERYFAKGYLGLKVPLSLGYGPEGKMSDLPRSKLYSYGFDFNFYPSQQKDVNFLVGLGLEYGEFKYAVPKNDAIIASKPETLHVHYNAVLVNCGLVYRFKSNLCFSFVLGLGGHKDREADYINYTLPDESKTAYNLVLGIGYKFGKK